MFSFLDNFDNDAYVIINSNEKRYMYIHDSPSGRIFKSPLGYEAFIPNPLPPQIAWNHELVYALSRADYLIGQLAREGDKLPNPHLLLRSFIAREAVLSSKIEGTQATLGEVLSAEAGLHVKRSPDELQEVQNYVVALEYGIARLEDIPLSLRLIREIHEKLMHGVRGAHATPGKFRTTQNWIGKPGCSLSTAKFVPPSTEELLTCLGAWETFLHDISFPPLVHIALCHYQFEAIHPFVDGNGRIGRLLISLLLVERKILPSPLLYLSAFFESRRDEYYHNLYSVSAFGTWTEWLHYFLKGVSLQAQDALSRAERINGLLVHWKDMIRGAGTAVPTEIISNLAINPYFTTKRMSSALNVAYSTAQRGIQKLEELGIVRQINDSKRNRVYCATALLDILEEATQLSHQITLEKAHSQELKSLLRAVEERGGAMASWKIDIDRRVAILPGVLEITFSPHALGGSCSPQFYRRLDEKDPDLQRDKVLIEDAIFSFFQALSNNRKEQG